PMAGDAQKIRSLIERGLRDASDSHARPADSTAVRIVTFGTIAVVLAISAELTRMELTKRERKDFDKHCSLKRDFIDAMAERGQPAGLIKEVSDEIRMQYGQHPNGVWIHPRALTRDLNASTFSQGGAAIQADVESDWIPL